MENFLLDLLFALLVQTETAHPLVYARSTPRSTLSLQNPALLGLGSRAPSGSKSRSLLSYHQLRAPDFG